MTTTVRSRVPTSKGRQPQRGSLPTQRQRAPEGSPGPTPTGGRGSRPLLGYYLVLNATGLLLVVGLLMVASASIVSSLSAFGSAFTIVNRQLLWAVVGLPLMWGASRLPLRLMRRLAYPMLLVVVSGVVAVLVPGVGASANGARRWISLGGALRFQPSEPAKLALVIFSADVLARKAKLLGDWRHLLIPVLPLALFTAALVLLEPDMGTAMVLTGTAVAMLFVAGASGRVMAALGVGTVAVTGALAVAAPYRLARLTSFVDPFADRNGSGYQAVQGLYALSGGGWSGVGLGASRQKWGALPNAYTDYIFAILGEELGLAGTLLVLVLFSVLAYGGILIAFRAPDLFSQLAAAGITTWIMVQAVLNIGAVTSVLPITGIPLPLISFGGSSLAVTMVALGLLLSIARHSPHTALALAGRRSLRTRLAGIFGGPRGRVHAV